MLAGLTIAVSVLILALFLWGRYSRAYTRHKAFVDYTAQGGFDSHPVPMVVYDWNTLIVVNANKAAYQQYGYVESGLKGHSLLNLRRPCDSEAFLVARQTMASAPGSAGNAGEWVHRRSDGTTINVSVSYQIFCHAGKKLCLIACTDITARCVAEKELLDARRMLECVLNSVPASIYWKDADSTYLGCNNTFAREIGIPSTTDVIGMTDADMPWREYLDDIRSKDSLALSMGGTPLSYTKVIRGDAADDTWLAVSKVAMQDGFGRTLGLLVLHEDITTRRNSEVNLKLRSRALDACVNAVLITRPTETGNLIEYANPAFERITGYPRSEWVGRDCAFLQRDDRLQEGLILIRQALVNKTEVETTVRNYRRDGTMFFNHLYIGPVRDEQGVVTHHIAVINDVTETLQSRQLMQYQANYDALTALPNRSLFMQKLGSALVSARESGARITLAFLDVDHFKDVNDSLGHAVGDGLLKEVADRLVSCLPAGSVAARYGGDEFVLFIPGGVDKNSGSDIATRVSEAMSDTAQVDGHELYIDCSLGICEYPADGLDAQTLIKRADAAMYEAKLLGSNQACRYDHTIGQRIDARLALTQRLKRAVKRGEFTLVYQPQVDVVARTITAVEALIRWRDPELGDVPPSQFIPLAEDSGLIIPIGEWVLSEACKQGRAMVDAGHEICVAVNVSPRQFAQGSVEELVSGRLDKFGLSEKALELEITESTLTNARFIPMIRRIAARGVQVAVDDFGTGYSNLSSLRTVRPDRIKLDISLVQGIGKSVEDEALVLAVLALGTALGASVLAEGVETVEQHDFLVTNGCKEMQGYLFAKPMTASALDALLQAPHRLFDECAVPGLLP